MVSQWVRSEWVSQSVREPTSQSVSQSVRESVSLPGGELVNQRVSRWISQWVGESVVKSVSQWISQSVSQLMSQWELSKPDKYMFVYLFLFCKHQKHSQMVCRDSLLIAFTTLILAETGCIQSNNKLISFESRKYVHFIWFSFFQFLSILSLIFLLYIWFLSLTSTLSLSYVI